MLVTFLRFLDFPNVFRKLPECCRESQSASSRQNPAISSKSEHKSAPKISKSRFERILRCHHISFTTVSSFLQLPNTFGKLLETPARLYSASARQNREISSKSKQKCVPKIAKLVYQQFRALYNSVTFSEVS